MPKVIIREYDNSTAGNVASSNFAVVVPGFVGYPKAGYDQSEVFDDNGVFECTSQADFVNYIGLIGAKEMLAGEDAVPLARETSVSTIADYEFGPIQLNTGNVVFKTEKNMYYFKRRKAGTTTDEFFGLYRHSDPVVADAGFLHFTTPDGKGYKLTPVTDVTFDADGQIETYDEGKSYILVAESARGDDPMGFMHYGNQIAYELLGMGYTVLFKKLPKDTEEDKVAWAEFLEPLKDKSVYNFRFITTGFYNVTAANAIMAVAAFNNKVTLEEAETYGNSNGRGDCIALIDINEDVAYDETIGSVTANKTNTAKVIKALGAAAKLGFTFPTGADKYTAIFAPRVTYAMSDKETKAFYYNATFPASFHYLACFASMLSSYNEWYAAAGYTRGQGSKGILSTTVKLGEIAINTLAPRVLNDYTDKAINLILSERGSYYMWGNRTAYPLTNSGLIFSHFLNIRQLCTTIKKQIYTACRRYTFDPNSDLLWINFVNAIKPTLEAMKADQGLTDYKITKVVDNTKAVLKAKIRIVPVEAVEDFDISIFLEDSLVGVTVTADEEESVE